MCFDAILRNFVQHSFICYLSFFILTSGQPQLTGHFGVKRFIVSSIKYDFEINPKYRGLRAFFVKNHYFFY